MRTLIKKIWTGILAFLAAPYRKAEEEVLENAVQWQHAGHIPVGPNCRCVARPIESDLVEQLPDCLRGTDFTHVELLTATSRDNDFSAWIFHHRRPERSLMVSKIEGIQTTVERAAKIALLRDEGWVIDGSQSNWSTGPVILRRPAILDAPEQQFVAFSVSRVGVWLELWRLRGSMNRMRKDAINRALKGVSPTAAPIKDEQLKAAHAAVETVTVKVNISDDDTFDHAQHIRKVEKALKLDIKDAIASLEAASLGLKPWQLYGHASEDAFREHMAKQTLLEFGFYKKSDNPLYKDYLHLSRDWRYGEADALMVTVNPAGGMSRGEPADESNVWRRALTSFVNREELREAKAEMTALGFTFSHRKPIGHPDDSSFDNGRDLYVFNRDGMQWAVDRVEHERAWVTLAKFVATERGQNGLTLTSRNHTADIRPADVDSSALATSLVQKGVLTTSDLREFENCNSRFVICDKFRQPVRTSTELFAGSGLTFLRMHNPWTSSFRDGIEIRHEALPGKPTIVVFPGNTRQLDTADQQVAWIKEVIALLAKFDGYGLSVNGVRYCLGSAKIGTFGPEPGCYHFANLVNEKEVTVYAKSIGEAWERLELELTLKVHGS